MRDAHILAEKVRELERLAHHSFFETHLGETVITPRYHPPFGNLHWKPFELITTARSETNIFPLRGEARAELGESLVTKEKYELHPPGSVKQLENIALLARDAHDAPPP
ncbi:MAG: hypothetical protein EOP84_13835 [Verrucomicrobiaceae bacterium]|nr:MAG: hypothetical protein EOP84_13835 [Verrucomicrobiaceae bacterium]